MAVFANNDKQLDGANGATIISSGTKIKGEINTQCHLHVDGDFEGVIHSNNTVNIGKNGVVNGEVFSEKLIVSGKLLGVRA